MTFKKKTVGAFWWSFIDNFSNVGIQFIIGVVLARLLNPNEFGLIGMISFFIIVSQTLINGGFSQALIRKSNCNSIDYSTVFYFNLILGVVLYLTLYFSATQISVFFNEQELVPLIHVLGVVIIIQSLTIIQTTILIKRINFKLQAKISIISSTTSGVVAIILAYNNYGVWSLVSLQIIRQSIASLLLWKYNGWRPSWIFSITSFKELFGFGSKILISGIIDTTYRNIYTLIIGKFFSATDLGFYNRADQFRVLLSQNINTIVNRVSYPILSSLQENRTNLRYHYVKLIRTVMFITFVLMLGLFAIAEPLILVLLGTKWAASIIYLKLLSFVGMMYPLHSLNLNMLKVLGRSDLLLKLEILKKFLAIPIIIIGIKYGIQVMIYGLIVHSLIAYYLNSFWSGKKIGYSFVQQIKDIAPSFFLAVLMSLFLLIIQFFIAKINIWVLLIEIVLGTTFIILICEFFRLKDYLFIKSLISERFVLFKRN